MITKRKRKQEEIPIVFFMNPVPITITKENAN